MQKITDNIFLLLLFAMAGTFILAASFIFFFVRYQRKMLLQREAMQRTELEHQEKLLHSVIHSQEEERKRIGRDLHDDVGSALSNLRMVMGATAPEDKHHKPLIDNIITTVRNISHALSPPGLELFGLEYALHELCDHFNLSGKLHLVLENHTGELMDKTGQLNSLTLYRVLQELLSNTVKHAEAKNAIIIFNQEDEKLLVTYRDDGKGITIDPNKKMGMGMQNIESRLHMIDASFAIDSSPGNGFKIVIELPLHSNVDI